MEDQDIIIDTIIQPKKKGFLFIRILQSGKIAHSNDALNDYTIVSMNDFKKIFKIDLSDKYNQALKKYNNLKTLSTGVVFIDRENLDSCGIVKYQNLDDYDAIS